MYVVHIIYVVIYYTHIIYVVKLRVVKTETMYVPHWWPCNLSQQEIN